MFRLLPPSVAGGPERNLPARSAPWVVVVIIVVTSGWTTTQAVLILAILTIIALLALILVGHPRRA